MKGTPERQRQIRDLVAKIRDRYQPARIVLFGSYAWGEPDRDSDVDLMIVQDTVERPVDRGVEVRRLLAPRERWYPPMDLWVITPSELSEALAARHPFARQVTERGEVMYDAS